MFIEIGQTVVTAFDNVDARLVVAGPHLVPVQHLVTGGDEGQRALRVDGRRRMLQRPQFLDVGGLEVQTLCGVVVRGMLTDVGGQIACRVDRRVDDRASPAPA